MPTNPLIKVKIGGFVGHCDIFILLRVEFEIDYEYSDVSHIKVPKKTKFGYYQEYNLSNLC